MMDALRRAIASMEPPFREGTESFMMNTDIRLLTVKNCCESGNFSRATFYRLAKNDPRFPKLIKIGGSTRVRGDAWAAYIDALEGGEAA